MRTLVVILTLLLAFSLHAQKLAPAASPESAGFSSDRLKRLDEGFKTWINDRWVNGAVALVIRNNKIVYHKSFGYDDPATKEPLAKDDIFRIASQTKAITSVAAMMLMEEGKFLLEDPVSKYIPSFAHPNVIDKFNEKDSSYTTVPAKREVTVRDLLTHTSGIGYAQIGSKEANAIYFKSKITAGLLVTDDKLLDAMTRLGKLPLMHQPGEKWTYGLNSDLLGCLVEVWSGMSLDEFFRTRIFTPLGMNDTYFNVPQAKAGRLVNFFTQDSTLTLVKATAAFGGGLNMGYPLVKKSYFSGGGGLSSTILDYGIFLQMLANGGVYNGVRILSPSSIRQMTVNQIGSLSLGDDEKFGLGFSVATEESSRMGAPKAGTYAWGGAFSTSYFVDPASGTIVLLYLQMWGPHTRDVNGRYVNLVYQALTE
ncbi:MAG TPA: serine hydrolase domain-containing protein [Chryseolinea sp.]|nr:serine hydrolase domain-containing protein [Chryseolinea sp.]